MIILNKYCPHCHLIQKERMKKALFNIHMTRGKNGEYYIKELCKKCEKIFKGENKMNQSQKIAKPIESGRNRIDIQPKQKIESEVNLNNVKSKGVKVEMDKKEEIIKQKHTNIGETKPIKEAEVKTENIFEILKKEEKMLQKEINVSEDELSKKEVNDKKMGISWGIVGIGQGGSRIAESFCKHGYKTCIINTAKQDMVHIEVPEENKLFLDFALGGVGKDLTLGRQALEQYRKEVFDIMARTFEDNIDMIFLCVGLGGGTGGGGVATLADICKQFRIPIGIVATLPMGNEGSTTKNNSIQTLDKLAKLAKQENIHTLMVVDNARIEVLHPDVSAAKLWSVANNDIVETLHMFNSMSVQSTKYMTLDPMDFARILATGNCTIYGKIEVKDFGYESAIAEAITQNINSSVLAEGFDLSQAVRIGVIIAGNEKVLDSLPNININYAFAELNDLVGGAEIFRGVYATDKKENTLTVYSIFSGLGLPRERIDKLIAESRNEMAEMEKKGTDKSKMDVLENIQTVQTEKDRYQEIKARNTGFGNMLRKVTIKKGRG